jgi:hypothetical protein
MNGRLHKAGRKEYVAPQVAGQDDNVHPIVPEFQEEKRKCKSTINRIGLLGLTRSFRIVQTKGAMKAADLDL